MSTSTGSHIEHQLLREFPLFFGKAPSGHPYPQAFVDGTDDEKWCYIEAIDDMVLLCRKLPSGRVISIDTCDFALLNGGAGIPKECKDSQGEYKKMIKTCKQIIEGNGKVERKFEWKNGKQFGRKYTVDGGLQGLKKVVRGVLSARVDY